VIAGVVVLLAGLVPWAGIAGHGLAAWNLRVLPSVPWAVVPTALYLWVSWRYLGGAGWPRSTAEWRRASLRANAVSGDLWGLSILPGLVLHAGGDVFSLTRLWLTGLPEWQLSTPPRLVWETGMDAAFIAYVIAFVVLSAGAFWAYRERARAAGVDRAAQ
jgi:hypothetical protein